MSSIPNLTHQFHPQSHYQHLIKICLFFHKNVSYLSSMSIILLNLPKNIFNVLTGPILLLNTSKKIKTLCRTIAQSFKKRD